MVGKKGVELVFGTVVIIILSLIVLAGLVLFFLKVSGKFNDATSPFFSNSNVDSFVKGCNILVQSNSKFEYCCEKKEVKLNKGDKKELTCLEASSESWGNEINKVECVGVC
jgi:hypothetical protein